jgi:hypothetical protein
VELATGTIVKIAGRVVKHKPYGSKQTHLLPINYPAPIDALVLGKSKRHTGTLNYGASEYDSNWLSSIVSHTVWIVMPLDKHHRFREPVAVLLEQIVA